MLRPRSFVLAFTFVALCSPRRATAGEPPAFRVRELQTRYLWAEAPGCEVFLGVERRSEAATLQLKLEQERCPLSFAARRAGLDALWQRLVRERRGAVPRVGSVQAPIYPEAAERLAQAALAAPEWARNLRHRPRRASPPNTLVLELMRRSGAYAELLELLRAWGQRCELAGVEKVAELTGRERNLPASMRRAPLPRGQRVPYPLMVYLRCDLPPPATGH